MTENQILYLAAAFFALVGFLLLYVAALKVRGIALFLLWLFMMTLFALSAELHMLPENANSWDFAFAVLFQTVPLMLGGTVGVLFGTHKRNSA